MTASVYLADLRHNFSGVLANDCMPLGVAYMKAVMDRDLPEVRSRLFAYPDRLSEALHSAPPDVLMLSNYMWNEQLSLHFARLAKRLRPETLVVMGGPNLSLETERQREYLALHPELDVYVLGEGDFLAKDVVAHFLAADQSLTAFGRREVLSSVYRRDGEIALNTILPRRRDLDQIPSPWLTGVLDEFFDGKLAPMIETNRGCPFTCTFCVQGISWYTKVNYFNEDRLRAEIEYIAAQVHARSPQMGTLRIADSNYGMFERDTELSGHLGEMQRRYGWPTFIDATTGKNKPQRIIESLERVSGALVLYQAVQSLDEGVLKQVKRQNIKTDAYEEVMIHVRGRGLRSLSDLILALPGETLASHLRNIHSLVNAGTHEMHNFQSMMLKGSEMETGESRARHRFDTRFRVLPKNFGEYHGERIFDMDEIVVSTETLDFDAYVSARKYHLVCSIFWNNSWFEDTVRLALQFGVKPSEWLDALYQALEQDQGVARRLLDAFVSETVHELFPSAEACAEFYSRDDNFERLQRGEIGDNLMYKYRALASFFEWPAIAELALQATRRLLLEKGADRILPDFDEVWDEFARRETLRHAHGVSVDEVLPPVEASFRYDIEGWVKAGLPRDVGSFAFPEGARTIDFRLSEEGEREFRSAFAVWSTSLKGLTKMVTRIRSSAQVRSWQLRARSKPRTAPGLETRPAPTV